MKAHIAKQVTGKGTDLLTMAAFVVSFLNLNFFSFARRASSIEQTSRLVAYEERLVIYNYSL